MIGNGQAAIDLTYAAVYGSREAPAPVQPVDAEALSDNDAELIQQLCTMSPGFRRWWEEGSDGDESDDDWGKLKDLLRATGFDADRTEQLAQQSQARRPRWDEPRGDKSWLRYTIDRALEDPSTFNAPHTWPRHEAPAATTNSNGHHDAAATCTRPARECAELRRLHSEVGRVITSPDIPNERKAPYLSLLIYAKSRQTRPEQDPESGKFVSPVVTAGGFVRLPRAENCKKLLGMSYSQQLARRKELVTAGLLEERKEVAIIELDGRPAEIEVPYISPGERPLAELIRSLHTIAVPTPSGKRGGKRVKRCKDHFDAPLKAVCSICGNDPVWIELPPDPDPISNFETGADASGAVERDTSSRLWGPLPSTGVGSGNGTHTQHVDRTTSVESSNGSPAATRTPISNFETGPPGDGQDTAPAAARAYAQSAAEGVCTCCGVPSSLYDCPECKCPSGNRLIPCHPCLYGAGP